MAFQSLFLIALALSLDAFSVSLSVGLNSEIKRKNKIQFSLSFGFFQFLFAIIGAYAGFLFNKYIASVPAIVGGAVVSIVGILMLKAGFENKKGYTLMRPGMVILLGVSVSIDALVIGFTTLNNITNNLSIICSTLFIGIVTFVLTSFAFIISRYLQKIHAISKYADYIGGVILIIFGIKMMFFK
ncbi:manganese efflux pump MntP family protein [Clostridium sp. WILCCON 0269]|uniref:Putative manganese efflux pump MntP n=1 Tax=Candidatus Clostridium eludens TaxID=3381663 RepID=A0ABW8SH66_9CLOT